MHYPTIADQRFTESITEALKSLHFFSQLRFTKYFVYYPFIYHLKLKYLVALLSFGFIMQTCCWKRDYSRLSSFVFNYKIFIFLHKGCSSCVQKLITSILTISQLTMEACKLLSVEINRKDVGGKLVSTFDYDTSSTLQKMGNVK